MTCNKDEAIFYRPITFLKDVAQKNNELIKQVNNYLDRIYKEKDDRIIVITTELLIEHAIEMYLSKIMPSYQKNLSDNVNFNFYLKIEVAKSLALSPKKFFEGADLIRRIRNNFVHNLEMNNLDDVKLDLKNQIDNVLVSYFPKQFRKDVPIQGKFRSLAFATFIGITKETQYLELLASYLRDDDFWENFLKYCNK